MLSNIQVLNYLCYICPMTKVASSQQEAWGLMLEIFMAQRGKMLSVAQEFGLHPQQAMALEHPASRASR